MTREQTAIAAIPAIREFLDVLGFEQMAKDILKETKIDRIVKYVGVIVKSTPNEYQSDVIQKFQALNLY